MQRHTASPKPFALSLSKGRTVAHWDRSCFDRLSTNGLMNNRVYVASTRIASASALTTPCSVMSPVTSRAGVTSKP